VPDRKQPDRKLLLVAGAGGGLAGALRAAQLGLDVVVVEANPQFRRGNNTSMSTAMVPGADSRFQRAAGLRDSPQAFAADVAAKTHGAADPALTSALAEVSARLVEWLADDMQLPIELVTDFDYPGHSVCRCHTVPGRSGASLLQMLADRVGPADIDMMTPAELTDAQFGTDGVTASIRFPDGSADEIPADALLLATNGFGADSGMVERYIPEIHRATYHGSAWSRGHAVRIGTKLGAGTAFMDAYQGHGALTVGTGTLAGWATVMHGGIIVNRDGRRFADETQGYSEFAKLELAQPDAWVAIVIDQRIAGLCANFDDFRQTAQLGALRWAGTPEELAARLGVPAGHLAATLAETGQLVRGGGRDRYGRAVWPAQPLTPPLAAIRVGPALFHTQGGLRVDGHARVTTGDGQVIPGLYAAGGAAMGISGHGAAGYLAGNGLLSALGLSFLAAEHLAGQLQTPRPPRRAGP
jgi:fumarate reductase flavoprotein subunit